MKYVGPHVSTVGGVKEAPGRAKAVGAGAFALFTGSNTRWKSAAIKPADAEEFRRQTELLGFSPRHILPHDKYLINLGSPDPEKEEKSRESFLDELRRCEILGLQLLNFHPGSHLGQILPEDCLDKIADNINYCLERSSGVTAVIENTAGQGSNLGYDFAQIARIIDRVEDKERIGVCIDTCHAYSAGYDLATEEGYRETWRQFDEIIGSRYLKAIHLNDDKRELGSRIDRHASIGLGTLGMDFFARFMRDPRFDDMPIILETPDEERWPGEIRMLMELSATRQ